MEKDFKFRLAIPVRDKKNDRNESQESRQWDSAMENIIAQFPDGWKDSPEAMIEFLKKSISKRRAKRLIIVGPDHPTFTNAVDLMGCKKLYVNSGRLSLLAENGKDSLRELNFENWLTSISEESTAHDKIDSDSPDLFPPEFSNEFKPDEARKKLDRLFQQTTRELQPILIGACFCLALDTIEAINANEKVTTWLYGDEIAKGTLPSHMGIGTDRETKMRVRQFLLELSYGWMDRCSDMDEEPWISFRKDGLTPHEKSVLLSMACLTIAYGESGLKSSRFLNLLPPGPDEFAKCLETSGNLLRIYKLKWLLPTTKTLPDDPFSGYFCLSMRAMEKLFRSKIYNLDLKEETNEEQIPQITLNDVVLRDDDMRVLRDATEAWKRRDEFKDGEFQPPTFLFHGLPGTGKSLAARALAGTMKMPVVEAMLNEALRRYVGDGEKYMGRIFKQAKEEGALLILNEADTLILDRSTLLEPWQANMPNTIIQLMDEKDVPVVFTTNFIDRIDWAIKRRLQTILEFPVPEIEQRKRLWRIHLDRFDWGADIPEDTISDIVITGALIENAVNTIHRQVIIKDHDPKQILLMLREEAVRQSARIPGCSGNSQKVIGFGSKRHLLSVPGQRRKATNG